MDGVTYGVEKMCFAKSYASMDKEGVVRLSGMGRNAEGCRFHKLIGGTFDEMVKGVERVEGKNLSLGGRLLKDDLLFGFFGHDKAESEIAIWFYGNKTEEIFFVVLEQIFLHKNVRDLEDELFTG